MVGRQVAAGQVEAINRGRFSVVIQGDDIAGLSTNCVFELDGFCLSAANRLVLP